MNEYNMNDVVHQLTLIQRVHQLTLTLDFVDMGEGAKIRSKHHDYVSVNHLTQQQEQVHDKHMREPISNIE